MTFHSYMGIAGCLQGSTLCIGTDDEGEGDDVEGTTTTAVAPALALVTIDSFRYENNSSESKIDKTEKVNRYLADHNYFSDAWCIERVLKNGESNFYARCLIGCNPIKLATNDTRCDPFRNFIRHRQPNSPTGSRTSHEKKILLLTQRAERDNILVEDLIHWSVVAETVELRLTNATIGLLKLVTIWNLSRESSSTVNTVSTLLMLNSLS